MSLNLDMFPPLRDSARRTIYVSGMPKEERMVLELRGYAPVELMTLPRDSEQNHADYVRAKLQAIEEGTIPADEEDRKRLELEARAYGLLDPKRRQISVNINADSSTIDKLLEWDSGRHTLAGNSTAVHAQPPQVKKK